LALRAQRPATTMTVTWVSILACMFAFRWREEWFESMCGQVVRLWLLIWWKAEEIVVKSEMSKWKKKLVAKVSVR
jgi:hypothetical protein